LDTDPQSTGFLFACAIIALASLMVFAFRSACLGSFYSLDPSDISPFEEEGEDPNVERLRRLLRRATTTVLGLTAAGYITFALSLVLGYLVVYRGTGMAALPPAGEFWVSLGVLLVLAVLLLFFGHTLPLVLFSRPVFLEKNAFFANVLLIAMYPVAALLERMGNMLGATDKLPTALGAAEFGVYTDTAPVEDELEEEEREMISAIVEMGDTTVREIMAPRIDIVALDVDDPPEESVKLVIESPYSRFPVYEDTVDNIIGVLHIRDLLVALNRDPEAIDVRSLANDPLFVPESKKIDELLWALKREKRHMAIVTDEYGGTAGLVTIEDVLEEIVGEIQDEYDDEIQAVYRKDDGSFVVNASIPIEEFSEETQLELDGEGADTLGGLLYSKFGRIPRKGDVIHINGLKFTILSLDRNRIKLTLVEKVE
jgi:putative hemolysin